MFWRTVQDFFDNVNGPQNRNVIVRTPESSGGALRRRNNFRSRDGHEIGSAALISNGRKKKTQKKKENTNPI